MFYKVIAEYQEIISEVSISKYKKDEFGFLLIAKVKFIDSSFLHIKDYIFEDGKRKYSYHWHDLEGNLISRWDNSPHHQEIESFPHHRHLPDIIIDSKEHHLRDILNVIKTYLKQPE